MNKYHEKNIISVFRLSKGRYGSHLLVLQKLLLSSGLLTSVCTFLFSYTSTLLKLELKKDMDNLVKLSKKTVNDGEKIHSCSQCDFKSKESSNLKQHMRVHSGEKPFACTRCNYSCKISSNLKTHMLTHTGEKPFSCPLCNYSCTTTSSRKTHMRTHSAKKPHSCKQCNYSCTQGGNLKRHMMTHLGKKPLSCTPGLHKLWTVLLS